MRCYAGEEHLGASPDFSPNHTLDLIIDTPMPPDTLHHSFSCPNRGCEKPAKRNRPDPFLTANLSGVTTPEPALLPQPKD